MAYNGTITSAIRYFDGELLSNSTPTSAQARQMWSGAYLRLAGRLSAAGMTVTAGVANTFAADIEAYCTSFRVSEAQEIQESGEVSQNTIHLMGMCSNMRQELLSSPGLASSLGFTVSRASKVRPRSMATDYPNASRDTSDYENPLPYWKDDDQL